MAMNVAQKLIASHLADGEMRPGAPIALRIDLTAVFDSRLRLLISEF